MEPSAKMSAIGTLRHSAAAQQFGRFRSEADALKSTGLTKINARRILDASGFHCSRPAFPRRFVQALLQSH
jgi:hypothetical protein